jgi:hypothetical protein
MSAARMNEPSREPLDQRDREELEDIAKLARWVGALEVDDEYTLTLEQLDRLARLLKVAA